MALSTTKAEHVVYSVATQEVIWTWSFLKDFNLTPTADDSVHMLCDNTATIQFTKDLKFY